MKPSWSDAPEWAKYLAMDEDGEWFWYENKPDLASIWWAYTGKIMEAPTIPDGNCRDTLEPRPLDTSR